MTYSEFIKRLKDEWIGKSVLFEGESYNVIDVDYNGMLLINKPNTYNKTTAIDRRQAERGTS